MQKERERKNRKYQNCGIFILQLERRQGYRPSKSDVNWFQMLFRYLMFQVLKQFVSFIFLFVATQICFGNDGENGEVQIQTSQITISINRYTVTSWSLRPVKSCWGGGEDISPAHQKLISLSHKIESSTNSETLQ